MDTSKLTTDEVTLLTAALRSHRYAVAEVANGFDRAYGPADGRARDAWKNAQVTQRQIEALAAKLGLAV